MIAIQQKLAEVYLAQNMTSWAIVTYRRILELDPNNAETYLTLGRILARQNRKQEAIKFLEQAETLFNRQGNSTGSAEARQELSRLR